MNKQDIRNNILPSKSNQAEMAENLKLARELQAKAQTWLHPMNNEKLSEIIHELEWLEHLSKREV